jgi:ElaB/YqjD/DUF883 family membrane-anchored ribosome-binding protein
METPATFTPGSTAGNNTLARGIDQAGTAAHSTVDKLSAAARPAVDRVATGAHQAVDKFADVATQAAESLGVKGDQLKEAQARFVDACGGYVRANPVASLGIAVAAGFLLSRLISSR